jgi:hypothetical protein
MPFSHRNFASLLLASSLLSLGACSVNPPNVAPDMTAPPAIANDDNYVSHVATRTVNWDRASFRRWLEKEQMVSFLPKDQGIPGVTGTTAMRGTWGQNGSVRRVSLDNGHYAFDQVTLNQQPDLFQYQVYGFTNEAARVAQYIRAEFKYSEPSPGVTTLQWTYSMRPNSALTKLLVESYVNNKLRPYMEAGMDNMAAAARKAAAASR